jgi:hypothetical protein
VFSVRQPANALSSIIERFRRLQQVPFARTEIAHAESVAHHASPKTGDNQA